MLRPTFVLAFTLVAWSAAPGQRVSDLPSGAVHARAAALPGVPNGGAVEVAAAATGTRASHVRRGALWGLAIYGLVASAYVIHEAATCRGSECFGEGSAWIGLVGGVPVAIGIGAAVGAVWPVRHE